MDWSLPGSSVHGESPGKNFGLGCHTFLQGNLPNPGVKPCNEGSMGHCGRINDGLPAQSLGFMGVFLEGTFEPQWAADAGKGISNRGNNL